MPSGLVREIGSPGRPPSLRSSRSGIGQAGDGHAVLGFGVVDAVAARDVAARSPRHVQTAAQHLLRELQRQDVPRPAEQVDRHERLPAHRVDIGQGVGRRDPAPVVGVVHHGREEVGRGHDRPAAVDADHGGVVPVVQPDDQLAVGEGGTGGRQARDDGLQLAGRDLAGAAASVRVLGQPDGARLRWGEARRGARLRRRSCHVGSSLVESGAPPSGMPTSGPTQLRVSSLAGGIPGETRPTDIGAWMSWLYAVLALRGCW